MRPVAKRLAESVAIDTRFRLFWQRLRIEVVKAVELRGALGFGQFGSKMNIWSNKFMNIWLDKLRVNKIKIKSCDLHC